MAVGKMRIYACGGAGINIGHYFNNVQREEMTSEIEVAYIDASRANVTKKQDINEENCFILDADGSGKVRKENYDAIRDIVKQVILEHKPQDFNVVVFSASGGSGSVIGPSIVAELLRKELPVVAVVIGSDESKIAAVNTQKTLKSLEGIALKEKQPVVMHYRHNRRGKPRSEVDGQLQGFITFLSVLASKQIEEVDSRDVSNLIYYPRVADVNPRLAAMEVIVNDDEIYKDCRPHSIISIYKSPDSATLDLVPDYHCAGYAKLPFDGVDDVHFIVDVQIVQTYNKNLQATIDQLEEESTARVKHKPIVDDDEADESGMVL